MHSSTHTYMYTLYLNLRNTLIEQTVVDNYCIQTKPMEEQGLVHYIVWKTKNVFTLQ